MGIWASKSSCCHALLLICGLCFCLARNAIGASSVTQQDISISVMSPRAPGHDLANSQRDFSDWWPTAWVRDLISTLNLLVVGYIFYSSRQDRKRDRLREAQTSVGIFWIQDLILKPINEELHHFFDFYEKELEEFHHRHARNTVHFEKLRQDATCAITKFKSEFHSIQSRMVEPLIWVDDSFSRLLSVMEDIEDLVTKEFENMPVIPRENRPDALQQESAQEKFRSLRQECFKIIHSAQVDFVKC